MLVDGCVVVHSGRWRAFAWKKEANRSDWPHVHSPPVHPLDGDLYALTLLAISCTAVVFAPAPTRSSAPSRLDRLLDRPALVFSRCWIIVLCGKEWVAVGICSIGEEMVVVGISVIPLSSGACIATTFRQEVACHLHICSYRTDSAFVLTVFLSSWKTDRRRGVSIARSFVSFTRNRLNKRRALIPRRTVVVAPTPLTMR